MEKAFYKERENPQNKFEEHLKYLVIRKGKQIGEHAEEETAKKHVKKVNTQFEYLEACERTRRSTYRRLGIKPRFIHPYLPKKYHAEKYLPYIK